MPKYFAEKICGHWLYFTSHCLLEAMHVHAIKTVIFVWLDRLSSLSLQTIHLE